MNVEEVYLMIKDKLVNWMETLIKMLPNLVLAAIIIVLGFFIARWIRNKAQKIIRKITKIDIISNLLGSIIYAIAIGVVLLTALKILNLDKALGAALAGAGIVGLALAFAFQDIAANFVSGIFLSIRLPMRIGHLIQVKDTIGTVSKINLRDTVIRTFHGHDVIIPNKVIFDSPIINYSISNKRCIDLDVGVSYGDELPDVKKISLDALKQIDDRLDEQGALFYYKEFGDSSVNFFVRLWLKETNQAFFLETRSRAIMILKKTFDENNLSMPFPIRTLDFDPKGGKNISEVPIDIKKN